LKRYDADLVRNFSTQKRGDLFSGAELDQFVRRLNGSGYFASVQAVIDADPATADDATIRTAVIEAPRKKLEGGVGFSTDTRFRVYASYRDVDIDGHATQFYADGRIETDQQGASLRFVRPPNAGGWVDTAGTRYLQTDLNNLRTKSIGAAVRRASIDERNQWQFGAAFLDDRQEPEGGEPSTAHALYVDVERIWRRVDDLVAPTTGWILDVQAGAGVPGASTHGFGRTIARFAAWYPLSAEWELSGKLEGGAVFGASRQEVPATLLFRTGGDTTVRGYAFESLGVADGLATVPGRYFVVSSVDVTRWITATWGIAAFIDAGNAFDNLSDFKIALGYGLGARLRTPIGPFRFDVAYGQDSKQVRIHFSVGLAF
jgi:translocation and assembly module TamA